ncbi:MAG: glycosyltransferase family 9 protein [Phycisphaerae bacterium]
MHILISNPDGIGDVILRLPLFAALAEAGHDLAVICRPHAEHFLRRALPASSKIVLLRPDPYEKMRIGESEIAPDLLASLRENITSDTLLLMPSYQWTLFEEQVAALVAQAGGKRIRLNGFKYLTGTRQITVGGDERVVEVEEFAHEGEKVRVLTEAVLEKRVARRDPVLQAKAEDIQQARETLEKEWPGWELGGGYWLGLMGNAGDYYGEVKDWGYDQWVEVSRHIVRRGKALLLTGSEAERESLERIRRLSGLKERIAIVTGDITTAEGASLLLGLTSSAHAYIGKDSGPMHVAAALGKPVISLFGGGHWARFTPMVTPSLAVAVEMPCSPCGWLCGRSESFCVKLVPTARVIAAVDAVIEGSASRRVVELLLRECNTSSWKAL